MTELMEDSETDIELTLEAFERNNLKADVSVVMDGEETLDFLYKKGEYVNSNRPDLILLDLNLPKKSGFEVLQEIKEDQDLKRIPIVMLTTSDLKEDVTKAYNLHANSYLTKTVGMKRFTELIKTLEKYWGNVVTLPPE